MAFGRLLTETFNPQLGGAPMHHKGDVWPEDMEDRIRAGLGDVPGWTILDIISFVLGNSGSAAGNVETMTGAKISGKLAFVGAAVAGNVLDRIRAGYSWQRVVAGMVGDTVTFGATTAFATMGGAVGLATGGPIGGVFAGALAYTIIGPSAKASGNQAEDFTYSLLTQQPRYFVCPTTGIWEPWR